MTESKILELARKYSDVRGGGPISISFSFTDEGLQKFVCSVLTQGADARPVAIYQISPALHSGMWVDTDAEHYADYLDDYRRIVYATRDAAPSDAQDGEHEGWLTINPDETTIWLTEGEARAEVTWGGHIVRLIEAARATAEQSRDSADVDACAKAKEFMVAARNAQMLQDLRSVIATCADLKARTPYRHVEAQRLLPLLDAFLGNG